MNDFLNNKNTNPPKPDNDLEPEPTSKDFNINNYGTLPKGVGFTEIKNRKDGISEFL